MGLEGWHRDRGCILRLLPASTPNNAQLQFEASDLQEHLHACAHRHTYVFFKVLIKNVQCCSSDATTHQDSSCIVSLNSKTSLWAGETPQSV